MKPHTSHSPSTSEAEAFFKVLRMFRWPLFILEAVLAFGFLYGISHTDSLFNYSEYKYIAALGAAAGCTLVLLYFAAIVLVYHHQFVREFRPLTNAVRNAWSGVCMFFGMSGGTVLTFLRNYAAIRAIPWMVFLVSWAIWLYRFYCGSGFLGTWDIAGVYGWLSFAPAATLAILTTVSITLVATILLGVYALIECAVGSSYR